MIFKLIPCLSNVTLGRNNFQRIGLLWEPWKYGKRSKLHKKLVISIWAHLIMFGIFLLNSSLFCIPHCILFFLVLLLVVLRQCYFFFVLCCCKWCFSFATCHLGHGVGRAYLLALFTLLIVLLIMLFIKLILVFHVICCVIFHTTHGVV